MFDRQSLCDAMEKFMTRGFTVKLPKARHVLTGWLLLLQITHLPITLQCSDVSVYGRYPFLAPVCMFAAVVSSERYLLIAHSVCLHMQCR
jgi:hypothetical protein